MKTISLAIPFYNTSKYFLDCIKYARQEPHRKCESPDSDNTYLNMFKNPKLSNWRFV